MGQQSSEYWVYLILNSFNGIHVLSSPTIHPGVSIPMKKSSKRNHITIPIKNCLKMEDIPDGSSD